MEHAHNAEVGDDELKELMKGRDTRWYKGHLLKLNFIILLLLITSANNGYDGSMMNGLQTLDTWQASFGSPTGSLLGIFNAIQSIGGIAGLPFAPFFSDRYGRRMTMFIGASLMIIGTILQTAAQNIGMFLGCRFLIGFGLAFSCLAAPVLTTELAFPTHRGPITSLYNSSWYLGSIIAAWTTYGTFRINNTWGWRIPSALQGVPSIIQFCLIFFIPESPRWLVDHGKDEQAIRILAKHHCGGNLDDPLVQYEYQEIKAALAAEKEANASTSYKSLFTTRGNLRRMRIIIAIAFFSQWSGNGVVSYYLNLVLNGIGITGQGEKNLFNGILQVYNLATAYFGALTVDRFGRRPLFLTSAAGMCLSYMMWTIANARYAASAVDVDPVTGDPLHPNNAAGRAVIAAIYLYYGFYNIAMSPLLVSYTVEILPFRIRAKGLMVMQMCVNASLVFNQYANPVALKALDWKYYIIYTVWIAFEFVFLYLYLVETKGKNGPLPLEEIAALFDGKASDVASHAKDTVLGGGVQTGRASLDRNGSDLKEEEIKGTEHVENLNSRVHTLGA